MSARRSGGRTQERLDEARRWFRRHHAEAQPDAGFAARVTARLRRDPAEDLGQAALKLLPVSVALALALALLATWAPRGKSAEVRADFDVVEWIYGESVSSR